MSRTLTFRHLPEDQITIERIRKHMGRRRGAALLVFRLTNVANLLFWTVAGASVGFTVITLTRQVSTATRVSVFIAVLVLGILPPFLSEYGTRLWRKAQKATITSEFGSAPIEYEIAMSDEGLANATEHRRSFWQWPAIEGVSHHPGGFAIVIRPLSFLWIPRHAFVSDEDMQAFAREVEANIARHGRDAAVGA